MRTALVWTAPLVARPAMPPAAVPGRVPSGRAAASPAARASAPGRCGARLSLTRTVQARSLRDLTCATTPALARGMLARGLTAAAIVGMVLRRVPPHAAAAGRRIVQPWRSRWIRGRASARPAVSGASTPGSPATCPAASAGRSAPSGAPLAQTQTALTRGPTGCSGVTARQGASGFPAPGARALVCASRAPGPGTSPVAAKRSQTVRRCPGQQTGRPATPTPQAAPGTWACGAHAAPPAAGGWAAACGVWGAGRSTGMPGALARSPGRWSPAFRRRPAYGRSLSGTPAMPPAAGASAAAWCNAAVHRRRSAGKSRPARRLATARPGVPGGRASGPAAMLPAAWGCRPGT
mmetsp:Transcript_120615/g.286541  ORF Transcript_120615/g.286541 Transcript_120615/m.286541 type:complete len:350 (+) Transcript_120615:604-1653(+)